MKQVIPPSAVDPRTTEAAPVDRSLIRWMLRLTPVERLRVLEEHVALVAKLRHAQPR